MAKKRKKLAIIVPYRDRKEHLETFIPVVEKHLDKSGINYQIWIIEQKNDQLWNKGMLLNAGFNLTKDKFDYFCFHDVDLLPLNKECDYSYVKNVTHLSTYVQQYGFKEQDELEFIGGVVLFPKKDFMKINGYSNGYWEWGAEDSDIYFRCQQNNVKVKTKPGKYRSLPHDIRCEPVYKHVLDEDGDRIYWKSINNEENYFHSWSYKNSKRLYDIKRKWEGKSGYGIYDGRSTIKFDVVSEEKALGAHIHVGIDFNTEVDENTWADFYRQGKYYTDI